MDTAAIEDVTVVVVVVSLGGLTLRPDVRCNRSVTELLPLSTGVVGNFLRMS
jgi:hypothetical protein